MIRAKRAEAPRPACEAKPTHHRADDEAVYPSYPGARPTSGLREQSDGDGFGAAGRPWLYGESGLGTEQRRRAPGHDELRIAGRNRYRCRYDSIHRRREYTNLMEWPVVRLRYDQRVMDMSTKTFVLVISVLILLAIGIYAGIRSRVTEEVAVGQLTPAHPDVTRDNKEASRSIVVPKNNGSTSSFLDQATGWKVYRNEEYGYEIKYPEQARIKTRGPHRILIDIGGEAVAFSVKVNRNPENLSAKQWVEKLKARARRGEDAPMPIELIFHERGPDEGPIQVDTLSGYRFRVFAIDYEKDLVFFAGGPLIYELGLAAFDPNDPEFSIHSRIFRAMLETFRLLPNS